MVSWKIIVGTGFTIGLLMLLYSIPNNDETIGVTGLFLILVFGFIIWLYGKLR